MPHRPYILLIVKDFHKNYGGYYEKAYKKITYLGLVKLIGNYKSFTVLITALIMDLAKTRT